MESRRYPCTAAGCHRAYRRNEHLIRHLRSHNLQKPYDCYKCGKSYGRQDVLKRHLIQQHQSPNGHQQELPKRSVGRKGRKRDVDFFPCDVETIVEHEDSDINSLLIPSQFNSQSTSHDQPEFSLPSELHNNSSLREREPSIETSGLSSNTASSSNYSIGTSSTTSGSNAISQELLESGAQWQLHPATLDLSIQSGLFGVLEEHSERINDQRLANNRRIVERLPTKSNLQSQLQIKDNNTLRTGILEALEDLEHSKSWPDTLANGSEYKVKALGYSHNLPAPGRLYLTRDDLLFRKFLNAYFSKWHPLWPIIHKATLDVTLDNQDLVNSILMIGAWESGINQWKEMALSWNESLTKRLYSYLSNFSSANSPSSKWTIQAYQALLLNVAFSLQCSEDLRFSKAYFQYCMMIAIFRDGNLFEEQYDLAWEDDQNIIPTTWLKRESLKRLAFYSFWISVYFSFLRGYNPMLRYDELSLTTPCSERLWEAETVAEWRRIKTIESQKRVAMRFMNLIDIAMDCDGRDSLPALLEDEYGYGLCAMQVWIWPERNRHESQRVVTDAARIWDIYATKFVSSCRFLVHAAGCLERLLQRSSAGRIVIVPNPLGRN